MDKLYPNEDAAFRRVEFLKRQPRLGGPWPGVRGPNRDGWYYLTYDPTERDGDA